MHFGRPFFMTQRLLTPHLAFSQLSVGGEIPFAIRAYFSSVIGNIGRLNKKLQLEGEPISGGSNKTVRLESLQLAALTQTGRTIHPIVEGIHEEQLDVGDVTIAVSESGAGVTAIFS